MTSYTLWRKNSHSTVQNSRLFLTRSPTSYLVLTSLNLALYLCFINVCFTGHVLESKDHMLPFFFFLILICRAVQQLGTWHSVTVCRLQKRTVWNLKTEFFSFPSISYRKCSRKQIIRTRKKKQKWMNNAEHILHPLY